MKIQFDPKQQYQLDAVAAVVDVFEGQPLEQPDFPRRAVPCRFFHGGGSECPGCDEETVTQHSCHEVQSNGPRR